LRHANSDAHAIRVADGLENSSRGNKFYGEYNGPVGTLGGFKGDVARGIFYLDIRYNALQLVNGFPFDQQGKFGDLATLLDWHRNDPPDDFERNRNNIVYGWQNNRNPFIDHPEMVEYIWGNKLGQSWQPTSSTNSHNEPQIKIFPNPTKNIIQIDGVNGRFTVEFFDAQSRLMLSKILNEQKILSFEIPSGVYVVKIKSDEGIYTQKLVVE